MSLKINIKKFLKKDIILTARLFIYHKLLRYQRASKSQTSAVISNRSSTRIKSINFYDRSHKGNQSINLQNLPSSVVIYFLKKKKENVCTFRKTKVAIKQTTWGGQWQWLGLKNVLYRLLNSSHVPFKLAFSTKNLNLSRKTKNPRQGMVKTRQVISGWDAGRGQSDKNMVCAVIGDS